MTGFRFATPWAFLLLPLLAFAAWRLCRRARVVRAIPFAPLGRLPRKSAGWRAAVVRVCPAVFLAGASMLVVAMARPQKVFSRDRRSADAIAIAMAVDVSGSMKALDLADRPGAPDAKTRLDVVKDCFADFIRRRPDDLIALIAFGGFASTRSPLTADHEALLRILGATRVPDQGPAGDEASAEELLTAVGDGLATACARLRDAEPKTRIVVLLTDGVSNTGLFSPDEAAGLAAKLGVRVYTIGVGSNGEAPFRARDAFGRQVLANAVVEFDEGQLERISAKTGGRYFNVRDEKAFHAAMEEIGKLETTRVTREVYDNYRELYAFFLAAGSVLLALPVFANISVIRRPL